VCVVCVLYLLFNLNYVIDEQDLHRKILIIYETQRLLCKVVVLLQLYCLYWTIYSLFSLFHLYSQKYLLFMILMMKWWLGYKLWRINLNRGICDLECEDNFLLNRRVMMITITCLFWHEKMHYSVASTVRLSA